MKIAHLAAVLVSLILLCCFSLAFIHFKRPNVELPEEHMNIGQGPFKTAMLAHYEGNKLVLEFDNSSFGSYQIQIEEDSLLLLDHDRVVGRVPFGSSPIDSLIMRDNE